MVIKSMNSMPSAIDSINNIDNFLDSLTERQIATIKVGLAATISKPVEFIIKFNGQVISQQTLSASLEVLNTFTVDCNKENTLELTLEGKGDTHTIVNDQGEIVEDSFVMLSKLEIDSYDIFADDEFINNNSTYTPVQTFYKGFWHNSTFSLTIKTPFMDWYNQQTTRNTTVVSDQEIQGLDTAKMNNLMGILDKMER